MSDLVAVAAPLVGEVARPLGASTIEVRPVNPPAAAPWKLPHDVIKLHVKNLLRWANIRDQSETSIEVI